MSYRRLLGVPWAMALLASATAPSLRLRLIDIRITRGGRPVAPPDPPQAPRRRFEPAWDLRPGPAMEPRARPVVAGTTLLPASLALAGIALLAVAPAALAFGPDAGRWGNAVPGSVIVQAPREIVRVAVEVPTTAAAVSGSIGPIPPGLATELDAGPPWAPVALAATGAPGRPTEGPAVVAALPPLPLPTPDRAAVAAAQATAAAQLRPGGYAYALPIPGVRAYAPHADNSPAVDIPANFGTPVFAVAAGEARARSSPAGLGFHVQVKGDDGRWYLYAHLAQPGLGGRVEAGQQIGFVGSTGHSTGPHLHFAISDRPGADGWGDFSFGVLGGSGTIFPQPFLEAIARSADQPFWVHSIHELADNGCILFVATWSDGSRSAVPRGCPEGVELRREGSGATEAERFSERGREGCLWYVTRWSDGAFTRVPYACPAGHTLIRPAGTPVQLVAPAGPVSMVFAPPPAPPTTPPAIVVRATPAAATATPGPVRAAQPTATPVVAGAAIASAAGPGPALGDGRAPAAVAVPTAPIVTGRTKMGIGVYASGGHILQALVRARPGVILLMDPDVQFARDVRRTFPHAFIVGRHYFTDQSFGSDPGARGRAAADQVARVAAPLRGVVDAWMSYNEPVARGDIAGYRAWNAFQVEFARHLQGTYGLAAIAGNDPPGAISPEDYVQYFADAIRESRYFGLHAYPPAGASSLQAEASWYMLRHRRIHEALVAAGIAHGQIIITESGPPENWRRLVSQEAMAEQFHWYTRELEKDAYVIGHAIFGLFGDGRWAGYDPRAEHAGQPDPGPPGQLPTLSGRPGPQDTTLRRAREPAQAAPGQTGAPSCSVAPEPPPGVARFRAGRSGRSPRPDLGIGAGGPAPATLALHRPR